MREKSVLSGKEPIIIPARGCKFITGHPGESGWTYCGKTLVEHNSSWCEEHYAVVHGKANPKPNPDSNVKPTASPGTTRPTISLEDPLLLG
ncbi:MAG: hypothetical protein O2967_19580 [Proteobacteria bacterium]|nr:hypothetical protein [Pseudomonadota bacterium]